MGKLRLPLVIKVGGSLAETGRLPDMLQKIAEAERAVIVVPGGGAFADAVRAAQASEGFDDASAHRMAMGAMHKMAEVFVSHSERLAIADGVAGIGKALARGQVPVWVPLPMLEGDRRIPEDWTITSDGIAARFAELLGGAPVVLLKSVDSPLDASAEDLAAAGIVDGVFARIVARAGLVWRVFGPSRYDAFAHLLQTDTDLDGIS